MSQWWWSLIEVNTLVLGFGSGLLFFVTGLTVSLLARHYQVSRMPVARTLPLLGGFAMAYGLAQWGVVFIPVQRTGLSLVAEGVLRWMAVALDLVGAAALAGVGARLRGQRPWAVAAAVGALAVLITGTLTLGLPWAVAAARGVRWSVVPAAAWTAWALWRSHTGRLRLGFGGAFGLYALTVALEALAWAPGHTSLVRGVAGLALGATMLVVLGQLDQEYRVRLEESLAAQVRLAERHALGQMLQDSVLQQVYAVGLHLEGVEALLPPDGSPGGVPLVRAQLKQAMVGLSGAIEKIREFLQE
jgi:signal transduction histidine kinase